jgi:hypothetical protein
MKALAGILGRASAREQAGRLTLLDPVGQELGAEGGRDDAAPKIGFCSPR